MAISKIILNGVTQMDVTGVTVQASNLIAPNTAIGADGEPVTGTATGGISGTYMFPIEQNNDGIWVPVTTDFSEIAEAQSNGLAPIGYDVASGTFVWVSYYENYEGFSEALSYGYKEPYTDQSDYRNMGTADIWVTHGYYNGALRTDHTLFVTYGTQNSTATADKILSGYTAFGPNGIIDGTASGGGGTAMNVQVAQGVNRVATTTYTEVSGQSLTVAKTGTYNVYWTGYRSSTSGTSGSQLYINDSAYGTAQTTFSNNGQSVKLTGVSLTQGQEVAVRARARNTSYYMYVGNLTIEQTA